MSRKRGIRGIELQNCTFIVSQVLRRECSPHGDDQRRPGDGEIFARRRSKLSGFHTKHPDSESFHTEYLALESFHTEYPALESFLTEYPALESFYTEYPALESFYTEYPA